MSSKLIIVLFQGVRKKAWQELVDGSTFTHTKPVKRNRHNLILFKNEC